MKNESNIWVENVWYEVRSLILKKKQNRKINNSQKQKGR